MNSKTDVSFIVWDVPEDVCPADFIIEKMAEDESIKKGIIIFSQKCFEWFNEKSDRKESQPMGRVFDWDEFYQGKLYFAPLTVKVLDGRQVYALDRLEEGEKEPYILSDEIDRNKIYVLKREKEKFDEVEKEIKQESEHELY